MGYPTEISWTDATWNPIGGCSIASTGCRECYAQQLAGTRLLHHPLYAGTTIQTKTGPVFNGTMTVAPDDAPVWTWPLRWRGSKTPRRGPGARSLIFVGDMSDLFHASRPWHVIDKVFAAMAMASRHDFQVLTKRPDVMADYCNNPETLSRVQGQARAMSIIGWSFAPPIDDVWPLPNIWCGTSVERQQEADERVSHLLRCPAAVRFLSCEPLLGPVDLTRVQAPRYVPEDHEIDWKFSALQTGDYYEFLDNLDRWSSGDGPHREKSIDWTICGGESGPNARPMHPQWARDIRDQCAAAGVSYFFKQVGEWVSILDRDNDDPDWRREYSVWEQSPRHRFVNSAGGCGFHGDRLHVMERVGKHAAGAMLDGREWREFPR